MSRSESLSLRTIPQPPIKEMGVMSVGQWIKERLRGLISGRKQIENDGYGELRPGQRLELEVIGYGEFHITSIGERTHLLPN